MQAAEASLYVGQTISGRYRVDDFVGDGAFSGTFRARDLVDDVDVAIKILSLASSQDPDAVFEFQEETRLLELLQACSNVVRLIDSGRHGMPIQVQGGAATVQMDVSFTVLELASASLADVLAQR
jgi:serine/threonine protein kinase